jgi:hypothetical protein
MPLRTDLNPLRNQAIQRNQQQRDPRLQPLDQQLIGNTLALDNSVLGNQRKANINAQADTALQGLARQFNLDPGGLNQGRSIARFSNVEGARLGALSDLENQLAQERLQNIQTQSGVLGQREASDLASLQNSQNFLGQDQSLALNEADLFGGINGQQTLGGELGRGQLGLQTSQVTGNLNGQQTVQERQRQFENQLAEANIFGGGGAAPKSVPFVEFANRFNAVQGDPNYSPEYDYNRDGKIDNADFIEAAKTADANGNITTAGSGRTTLAEQQLQQQQQALELQKQQVQGDIANTARALGIEESRLTASIEQNKSAIEETQRQFNSNFTQYLQATSELSPGTNRQSQAGRLAERQLQQMDDAMGKTANDILRDAGLNYSDLDDDQRLQLATLMLSVTLGPNVSFGGGFQQSNSGGPGILDSIIGAAGFGIGSYLGRPQ